MNRRTVRCYFETWKLETKFCCFHFKLISLIFEEENTNKHRLEASR